MSTTTTTTHDVNELVERHLYLVDHVVNQLAARFPRHVDRDELRGAGAAGLVDAAHRYDPSTGVPFARYASIRIRGAILDATRTRDWATRGDCAATCAPSRRTTATLEESCSAAPRTPRSPPRWAIDGRRRPRAPRRRRHLDPADPRPARSARTSGAGSLADRRRGDRRRVAARGRARAQRAGRHAARRDRRSCPELPRRVLVEHHFEGRLLRDIADDLGVTEARASQLRHEALHALQAYFGTAYDGVPEVPADAPGKRRRAAYVAQVSATPRGARASRPSCRPPRSSEPSPDGRRPWNRRTGTVRLDELGFSPRDRRPAPPALPRRARSVRDTGWRAIGAVLVDDRRPTRSRRSSSRRASPPRSCHLDPGARQPAVTDDRPRPHRCRTAGRRPRLGRRRRHRRRGQRGGAAGLVDMTARRPRCSPRTSAASARPARASRGVDPTTGLLDRSSFERRIATLGDGDEIPRVAFIKIVSERWSTADADAVVVVSSVAGCRPPWPPRRNDRQRALQHRPRRVRAGRGRLSPHDIERRRTQRSRRSRRRFRDRGLPLRR